jgi:predicted nucleic acid-binding protein
MSGKLIDTNILVYLSKKQLDFDKVAVPGEKLFISVITYMEVLGYNFQSNHEKKYIEEICRNLPVMELERKIVETVIQIRQQRKIKLPDAIIVATAIVYKLELITANVADFAGIDKTLVITNPLME